MEEQAFLDLLGDVELHDIGNLTGGVILYLAWKAKKCWDKLEERIGRIEEQLKELKDGKRRRLTNPV